MSTEREVVMRLTAKTAGAESLRDLTRNLQELVKAQKAYGLAKEQVDEKTRTASRQAGAADIISAMGMGNHRLRRWDRPVRNSEARRQSREAARDILSLHEAPQELIEDVGRSRKQRQGKLQEEMTAKEQARQQSLSTLLEGEIGKDELEYQKNLDASIEAIKKKNKELEQQKRIEEELVKLGYKQAEGKKSAARRGESVNSSGGGGEKKDGGGFASMLAQGVAGEAGLGAFTKLTTAAGAAGAAVAALGMAANIATGSFEKRERYYYAAEQYTPGKGKRANPVSYQREQEKDERKTGWWGRTWGNITDWFSGEDEEVRRGEEGFHTNRDNSDKAWRKYKKKFGAAAMTHEQWLETRKSGRQIDFENWRAQAEGDALVGRAAARSRSRQRRMRLEAEQSRMESEAQSTMGMIGYRQQLTEHAGAQRQAVINAAAKNTPYEREQYIEDQNREIEYRQALAEAGGQGQFRQQAINQQLGKAQEHEGQLRKGHEQALQAEKEAQQHVDEERQKGAKGRGPEYIARAEENAKALTEQRKMIEEELIQAQERSLNLRKEGEQSILETIQRQSEIRRAMLQTVQRQSEMHKRQTKGEQEDLALMRPHELRRLHRISEKIRKGQTLTEREKDYAVAHRGVLGKQIHEVAGQRMGKGDSAKMIQDIQRNSGKTARGKELAAQEVKLKQEIAVAIKVDTQNLTDSLVKTIRPEIQRLMDQMKQAMQNEINRIEHQRRTQQATMFPDMRQG